MLAWLLSLTQFLLPTPLKSRASPASWGKWRAMAGTWLEQDFFQVASLSMLSLAQDQWTLTHKRGGVVKVKTANLGAQSPVFFPQLEWAAQQTQALVLSAWPSGRVHAHNPPVIPQVVLT